MQTIEVSYINRRKEKITADTISFTESPGWLAIKIDGVVTEMISASIVKRLKFFPTDTLELVVPEPVQESRATSAQPSLLRLPTRREIMGPRHVYSPLLSQTC